MGHEAAGMVATARVQRTRNPKRMRGSAAAGAEDARNVNEIHRATCRGLRLSASATSRPSN
jgi:hypothetical protein